MNKFPKKKLRSLIKLTIGGYCAYAAICYYKGAESFYKNFVMPIVHLLDPEEAHKFAILANKHRLVAKSHYEDPEILKVNVFDKVFSNPIGIAAGFDKDGKAILGLKDIGFGFVEVGSVTPEPQPGNEKPRVFRLSSDLAIINRYGFNSEGHDAVLQRIKKIRLKGDETCIIGVNLGKNSTSQNPVADYVQGVKKFGSVADYFVINISSPNTPGLRKLQNKENLRELLKAVLQARNSLSLEKKPPLLLKLAPDLTYEERKDIADTIKNNECKVDGLVVSNTTIERPESLHSVEKSQTGGLSGEPLKDVSTKMIADMYKLTNGIPIIGVGGISSGEDAYEKIKAGAVLIQLYTSLVFEGPPVVTKIKRELVHLLIEDKCKNVIEAVGKAEK